MTRYLLNGLTNLVTYLKLGQIETITGVLIIVRMPRYQLNGLTNLVYGDPIDNNR